MFGKSVVYEFSVRGMSCGHCKASVEKALKSIGGVKKVEVDLENGKVKVKADPSVKLDTLKATVNDAGYTAV